MPAPCAACRCAWFWSSLQTAIRFGRPDVKSVAQLKGKVIGILSCGGAEDILTQTILAQNGVAANKDATLIVIGSPEELVTALRTGRIAACLFTQPRQLILYREGFTKHRNESIEIISKYLGIKDRSLATEVYDLQLSRLGGMSYLDDAGMRGAIDLTKKSMNLTKEVAPNQVFDFSFAAEALGRSKN